MLTNAHVVVAVKQVILVLSNGAEILGTAERLNKARDVALIKVPLRIPNALQIRTADRFARVLQLRAADRSARALQIQSQGLQAPASK